MATSLFFLVPAVVLVGLVLPLWLVLHYMTGWREQKRSGGIDSATLGDIETTARRLEDRIASLERVLDAEDPAWREKA
ncbi:MAG: envelope stress response membrane protein PspB [Alphaproteobacteria bacterium]|nr:envelope stress response membrane protein PspB [Alphaproteobacteria bacterium]